MHSHTAMFPMSFYMHIIGNVNIITAVWRDGCVTVSTLGFVRVAGVSLWRLQGHANIYVLWKIVSLCVDFILSGRIALPNKF